MLDWLRRRRAKVRTDAEFWRLRDELSANVAEEERLAGVLLRAPGPFSAGDVTEQIWAVRDERVKILRRLGWTESADKLKADTAAQRRWSRESPDIKFD